MRGDHGSNLVTVSNQDSRGAVVDIGTNSVKLLVADVRGGAVTPLWETSEQTRLGAGFYETRHLQPERIAHTARVVAAFVADARRRGASRVRIIATSAAREAVNASELTAAVEAAGGVPVEIISGEQEADWGFAGVLSNPSLSGRELLILDVGGGSTEVILGGGASELARPRFRRSFPLGSVRLLERFGCGDTPTPADLQRVRGELSDYLRSQVRSALESEQVEIHTPRAVGIGGTTAILALVQQGRKEFDRASIEATEFSQAELSKLVERLWSIPLVNRRQLPGLPPERADVILFGAAIYEAVLREFRLPVLGISLRGLRYAAMLS